MNNLPTGVVDMIFQYATSNELVTNLTLVSRAKRERALNEVERRLKAGPATTEEASMLNQALVTYGRQTENAVQAWTGVAPD
jgi:hypothetical protein